MPITHKQTKLNFVLVLSLGILAIHLETCSGFFFDNLARDIARKQMQDLVNRFPGIINEIYIPPNNQQQQQQPNWQNNMINPNQNQRLPYQQGQIVPNQQGNIIPNQQGNSMPNQQSNYPYGQQQQQMLPNNNNQYGQQQQNQLPYQNGQQYQGNAYQNGYSGQQGAFLSLKQDKDVKSKGKQ